MPVPTDDPILYSPLSPREAMQSTTKRIPLRNVNPLLRQITGLSLEERKNYAQKGWNRFQFDWVEVAPIDSPVFQGTPTCPTPEAADPALSIVNKQYVTDVLTGSIGGISLDSLDDVEAANPGDGEALVYDDSAGVWVPGQAKAAVIVATSSARPIDPIDGSLWFNTDEGILYVWEDNNENWIDVRPGPDGTIKAQGYDVPGPIKIEDLDSIMSPNTNDQFIVQRSGDHGVRITKSITWYDMVRPLLDRIEELERRLG